ncbi:hypothetical protein [Mucilaginibacter sp. KACC 22063]|uniref:hypothetical protein n=1 Tax=Mucilaginibacter sp. KACC 22063 TaxID=3025666 RepID=UPI0023669E3D|nr:hypothetical protein [Mucilaginibacter sp. KACC 22063]WDF54349.1 hypothetical protein PQ461_15500 [Mucilaginibacter sp. KACC 22063]
MGINRSWETTLSFRKFRQKTSDLSRIYWTQQMSADCLKDLLTGKPATDISTQVIGSSFNWRMHTQTVEETLKWLPTYMERNRLHLLVIYTSFLETYLKEVTFFYIAAQGHVLNPSEKNTQLKLTKIGEAISSPILKSSTVPEMLKYAAELFEINFGRNATEWLKIYKVRCAAAHNGGIATPKFLQEISGMPLALNPQVYENIGLTWDELRLAMKYADEIAALIDSKITSYNMRLLETDQTLRELSEKRKLPKKAEIWQFLHNKYHLFPIKRIDKNKILAKFY